MGKREKKKNTLEIEEMCVFNLAHIANVERLVVALSLAGYLTKTYNSSGGYLVHAYKIT